MLTIYTSKKYFTEGKKFIYNVDALSPIISLNDDEFTRIVLEKIELAKRQDEKSFIDRFGRGLFNKHLSTGTKTLLLLHADLGLILNGIEMGYNCWDYLSLLNEGEVYLPNKNLELSNIEDNVTICLNDKVFFSIEDLNDALEEADYDF